MVKSSVVDWELDIMNTGCIWHHNQPLRHHCHLIWLHQRYPDLYPHLSSRRQQAMSRAAINTRVRFMVCSSNDPAQHRQIHRIKYEQVLIFENHLSELMTLQSIEKVFYNQQHLNLDKLSTAKKRKSNSYKNFILICIVPCNINDCPLGSYTNLIPLLKTW